MDKLRAIRQWVEDGIEMGNRPDTMEDWDSDPNWHTQYYDHKTYDTQDWMRFLLEEYDRLERELAAANAKIDAVKNIVWGVRTLVTYPADEGITDIGDILEGKNSTASKE